MNATLFKNVHVLDVRAGQLLEDHQVLVEGDAIRELSDRPITATTARVIDGGGRTLMPGLIDCHVHVTFSQTNLGFKGTTVTHGRARGVVVATGTGTELGTVAGLLNDAMDRGTPLQLRLARFSKQLSLIVLLICAALFGFGLGRVIEL